MDINEIIMRYYKLINENNLDFLIVTMKIIINKNGINVISDEMDAFYKKEDLKRLDIDTLFQDLAKK